MKRLVPFVVILLLVLAGSQAAEVTPVENRVSLDLPAGTIKSALEALFKGSGKTYVLPEPIAYQPTAPLSIVDVSFDLALRCVCTSSGLISKSEDGQYIISAAPQPAPKTQQSSPAKEPAVGMNKYALIQVLGKPQDSVVYGAGDELWFYRESVIKFRNARVAAIESAAATKLTFRVSGKAIPYLEMLRIQAEARAEARANERRQIAQDNRQAHADLYNRRRYVVLKGNASDLATMAQHGQYPNTVFIQGAR